jgi:hypothetical protein
MKPRVSDRRVDDAIGWMAEAKHPFLDHMLDLRDLRLEYSALEKSHEALRAAVREWADTRGHDNWTMADYERAMNKMFALAGVEEEK